MNTFEITIQRKSGDSWPIVVEQLVTLWTNVLKQLFPVLRGMDKLQYPLSLNYTSLGLPFL
ncbi:hypothetical protein NIES4072_47040 [Nostoc commune NIES-4072]|uniref:Uncharacterized protein n=1 Tax=Nostoc commune NIES-4072 TaxID=2005467 RepID=A0A2R5FQJ5_NOSCO|nr:hypothetical protein [Nostoc commune]BBD67984.1 hypothetical protein NIES4070_43790 [Nostoc commune HK-02]GBG21022.1 hypothetical protein NIES4072_47040 [Nostoc commune NIES-4072]